MYAVVMTGGKQVKVEPGAVVRVERIDAPVGELIELNKVCLVVKDDGLVADPEALAGAKVVCQVVAQDRAKKKRRMYYARLHGHRQAYTELRVRDIQTATT